VCVVKTPKVSTTTTAAATEKDPIVIRNQYLDGVGGGVPSALRVGRSRLRIERAAPGASASGAATASPPDPTVTSSQPASAPAATSQPAKPVRGWDALKVSLDGAKLVQQRLAAL
jgi:hypothetical protein